MGFEQAAVRSRLEDIAVVIPAWQPDHRLLELARSLVPFGFAAIVVVNDGSSPEHEPVFEQLRTIPSVVVLHHARNRGQGCAVRTGLRYALDNLPAMTGAVTADADGQHAVADMVRIAEALMADPARLVLGVRTFGAGVPLRCRFGNIVTQYAFRFLSGCTIVDTQTGLRAIPRQWIPEILRVEGSRFEFAVSLLARVCRRGVPLAQMPIATIYIDQNRSSHFKPLRDSVRIYLHLLRCYAALLLAACIDLTAFLAVWAATASIALAMLAGRLAAVACVAVAAGSGGKGRLGRRIACLAVSGILSFAVLTALAGPLHWNVVAAKIVSEFAVYFALDAAGVLKRLRGARAAQSGAASSPAG